jgi:shikimate dehydrogenase
MHITGSTRLTGLFGYPVSHTISPQMHNAGFRHLGLDVIYLPFSVHPKNLGDAIKSLSALGFIGINVTIPHKQTVMKYLDVITPSAKMIGAVNTILVKGKKLIGYNTDGIGFVRSLKGYGLRGKTMFLLGAGGAGRAVAIQSTLSGLKRIFIADKLIARAKDLARKCRGIVASNVKEALEESDIIVNATPVGLHPDDPISIPAEWIPKGRLVYDLIYNPKKTKLLKEVKGCRTVNGLGMLLYQGASSFEIWTGKRAPVNVMRKMVKDRP